MSWSRECRIPHKPALPRVPQYKCCQLEGCDHIHTVCDAAVLEDVFSQNKTKREHRKKIQEKHTTNQNKDGELPNVSFFAIAWVPAVSDEIVREFALFILAISNDLHHVVDSGVQRTSAEQTKKNKNTVVKKQKQRTKLT